MKPRPLPPGAKRQSEQAKKVFEGVRFDIYQWQQKQFDESTATYEIVKRNDTVIIIPVIDDEIVLVKEQQPHWDKPGLTLVAGMVNQDEDLKVAARRELEEETGLVFETYNLVHIESPAPGIEWFAYTFVASGYKETKEKKLDPGEKNETIRVSIDEVIKMTREDQFFYKPIYIREMIVRDKLNELKDVLKNPEKYSIKI